jgi:alpha-ketoglutaric semialdehyde dehydrogenase
MTETQTLNRLQGQEYAPPKTFLNYIDGKWQPAASGKTFESRNPADPNDIVGVFQASGVEDVNLATAAAKKAYENWRLTPAPKRAEILYRAGQLFIERKEELSRELTREMGKVLAEARGDIQEVIDMVFYAAGEGRRLFGQTTPSELRNKFAMSVRVPLGVVGAITPWNFPMAIPSWKVAPALVAGNTVVFKPASDTPLVALRFVEIFEEAGLPPGVLNFITGGGGVVGDVMAQHPDIKLITFTGSCEVGRHVNQLCAPSFKRISLELGGKNATIVLDDANLDLAVDGILWGAFGTAGQRCTATSRVIVQRGIHAALREKLLERTKTLKLGYGLEPSVDVGPVINEASLKKIAEYAQIGEKEDGATLLCGGKRATEAGPGWFFEPTIFDNVTRTMRIAQEEIFGPITAIMPVADLDEAISVANDIEFGLSTAIYTRDVNKAFVALRDLDSGISYVNAPTIGAEVHLPFGGTKNTGNGHREAAEACLDTVTEWKTLYIDYSDKLQRAQIDPVE